MDVMPEYTQYKESNFVLYTIISPNLNNGKYGIEKLKRPQKFHGLFVLVADP